MRCPACRQVLVVPDEAIKSGTEAVLKSTEEAIPAASSAEGTPRRRRFWRPLFASGVAGLLLLFALLAYWWLDEKQLLDKLVRGSQTELLDELDLIPPDAHIVIAARGTEWWTSPCRQQFERQLIEEDPYYNPRKNWLASLPSDTERFTFVTFSHRLGHWCVVTTRKPYDRYRLLDKLARNANELMHQDKTYYMSPFDGSSLHFLSDRQFVLGSEDGMRAFLDAVGSQQGPLQNTVKAATREHQVVIAVHNAPTLSHHQAFYPIDSYFLWGALQDGTLTLDAGPVTRIGLEYRFPEERAAREAEEITQSSLTLESLVWRRVDKKRVKMAGKGIMPELAQNVSVKRDGLALQVTLESEPDATGLAAELLFSALMEVRESKVRSISVANLKRLGEAIQAYHKQHGHLPPAVITDKNGYPLYSWRVELLPFLGEEKLYDEFRRDKPWNSPENFKLLRRMPMVYAFPEDSKESTRTHYQVWVGNGTPFGGTAPVRFADFTDGLANTLLIVETDRSQAWTEPTDLEFGPEQPLLHLLGRHYFAGTLALLADGSVRALAPDISEETLRAAITHAGGEMLGPDW
jgi:hypothetical protein